MGLFFRIYCVKGIEWRPNVLKIAPVSPTPEIYYTRTIVSLYWSRRLEQSFFSPSSIKLSLFQSFSQNFLIQTSI